MARPKIERVVCALPRHRLFEPPNAHPNHTVVLSTDEYEMLRLHDLEHLSQADAAAQMRISRPTAALLLTKAHQKVADALVNGKRIRIEDHSCCVCPVGSCCPKAKDGSCDTKHRCSAACKDRVFD